MSKQGPVRSIAAQLSAVVRRGGASKAVWRNSQHFRPHKSQTRTYSSSTNQQAYSHKSRFSIPVLGCVAAGSTILAASTGAWISVAHAEAPAQHDKKLIRLNEVRQHDAKSQRPWVTKGTYVYDITDWIAAHPGGPVILRAAGGSLDPYWDIFSIHKKQDVYDILEEYRIGEIDPRDLVNGQVKSDDIEDPFVNDPARDPSLYQHTEKPCNAETPREALSSFITPNEKFYVRNHMWVPGVDEQSHSLTVELPDGTEKAYSLADLKTKFQPFNITATLQCTGNRRKHMSEGARATNGLLWDVGAISNAVWTGVRLKDVLRDAGFDIDHEGSADMKHVQFVGAEAYGASIPIHKALDPQGDVMLAYSMNDRPLPKDHGYPLRVLAPGITAARSVKWLEKIVVAEEESQSQWQQRDYKAFGPNVSAKDVEWTKAPSIQETPVQAAITSISQTSDHLHTQPEGAGPKQAAVRLEGYAYSGGGRDIIRVDLSTDGGRSWQQAEILPDDAKGQKNWSWRLWQATVKPPTGKTEFVVKAVDDAYNMQPESYEAQYNFRGNLTTAWHRVAYPPEAPEPSGSG
jgi:sulfite oxidase